MFSKYGEVIKVSPNSNKNNPNLQQIIISFKEEYSSYKTDNPCCQL